MSTIRSTPRAQAAWQPGQAIEQEPANRARAARRLPRRHRPPHRRRAGTPGQEVRTPRSSMTCSSGRSKVKRRGRPSNAGCPVRQSPPASEDLGSAGGTTPLKGITRSCRAPPLPDDSWRDNDRQFTDRTAVPYDSCKAPMTFVMAVDYLIRAPPTQSCCAAAEETTWGHLKALCAPEYTGTEKAPPVEHRVFPPVAEAGMMAPWPAGRLGCPNLSRPDTWRFPRPNRFANQSFKRSRFPVASGLCRPCARGFR